jgi:hypothetical protein
MQKIVGRKSFFFFQKTGGYKSATVSLDNINTQDEIILSKKLAFAKRQLQPLQIQAGLRKTCNLAERLSL